MSKPEITDQLRVARRGGMTAEDLAKYLNVSVEQIERSLMRLISKGLVAEVKQND